MPNTLFVVIDTKSFILRAFDGRVLMDKAQLNIDEETTEEETRSVIEEFRTADSLHGRFLAGIDKSIDEHMRKITLKSLAVEKEYLSWIKPKGNTYVT
jgi:cytosine/adenosine deaminase-related metal-dependent hydrolase